MNPSSYRLSVQGWVGFLDLEPPCRVPLTWAEGVRAPPFQIFHISKRCGLFVSCYEKNTMLNFCEINFISKLSNFEVVDYESGFFM